jgi:hypothetical protein
MKATVDTSVLMVLGKLLVRVLYLKYCTSDDDW